MEIYGFLQRVPDQPGYTANMENYITTLHGRPGKLGLSLSRGVIMTTETDEVYVGERTVLRVCL